MAFCVAATQAGGYDALGVDWKIAQETAARPDDAIDLIRRLQARQGDFGVFLQLAHNWADFEQTKKSYESGAGSSRPPTTG